MNTIFLLILLFVIFLIRKPLVGYIKKLEIKSLNDKLDQITNDPGYQKTLKKNDLKPVDWLKNHTLSDLIDSQGKKKLEKENKITKKYGKTKGAKIMKGKLWIGMSKKELESMKGSARNKIEKISRGKKREEFFYDGYKNRQGNISYKFRVVLIDGKVDGWNDIKN